MQTVFFQLQIDKIALEQTLNIFFLIMKAQQKRVTAVLNQLYEIHEQLFGHKYAVGIQINEQSEFNKIIQAFRELIFTIRHTQEERNKRQNKKNYHQSPEGIRINYEIRQDIQRAEEILKEALKRTKTDTKKKSIDKKTQELIKKRQTIIQNCYELLKDVKQSEQGGVYQPPTYPTLNEIKKKLIGKEYDQVREDSVNIEQEEFFDQAAKKDLQIDKHLDMIIEGNSRIQEKMKNANVKIDETHQKIIKATNKTQTLAERVRKDEKNLAEILKTYRRPNQLCLDITLVLLVLALIGVIINMIVNG